MDRDSIQYRALARKPDYGENELIEDCHPLDLSKGPTDERMEEAVDLIDGEKERD